MSRQILKEFPSRSAYEELHSMDLDDYTMLLQMREDLLGTCILRLTISDIRDMEDCLEYFTRSMFCPKPQSLAVSSCFTFNSMIGKANVTPETSRAGAKFDFELEIDPLGYPPFIFEPKARISFHNSRQVVDPYEDGFSLEMGKGDHIFRLKKIEKNLLPYPYDTNCMDYLEKWKARGGYGPTNEKECFQECYTNVTSTAYGVIQNVKGCKLKKFTPETSKEIYECQTKNCGPACYDVYYKAFKDVSELREDRCPATEGINPDTQWIRLTIDLSTLETTVYNCSPKFTSIESFGSIGGYVGMWLGISLVAVFDFLSTAFELLKFPFRKTQMRKFPTRKTRVHRIKHQKNIKKVDREKNKFWSNYLTNVFRDSMLSGVPQILQAKSKVKKCVLAIITLSCLAGYIYQSSEFLNLFYKYETVVDIRLTNSNVTELPSITICNHDGGNTTKTCRMKPDWCEPLSYTYDSDGEICDCFPERYCENGDLVDRMVIPLLRYNDMATLPPDDRLKYIQNLNDVIRSCSLVVHNVHSEDCDLSYSKKSSVPFNSEFIILSGCFSLNTVLERPNVKPSLVISAGSIVLNVSIDEREYSYFYHPPQALISFHNPYHIVNPHYGGFTLSMSTQRHIFHLKKVVKKLLPHPYDTNCVDYMSRWKERGGRGPINHEDCYHECQLNISLKAYGCLHFGVSPYLMESVFCNRYDLFESNNRKFDVLPVSEFNQKVNECVKQNCGPACYEESYEVIKDVDDIRNEGDCNQHLKDSQRNKKSNLIHNITVIINLNEMPTTTYSYRPKFENVEFWSNVGGYIGIWLGMSFVALFDFFETVIGIVIHLYQKLHVGAQRFVIRILKV